MLFEPDHKPGRDHVAINVTLSILIGVDENDDDLPVGFSAILRSKIEETGAKIVTSSIVPQKRLFGGAVKGNFVKSMLKDTFDKPNYGPETKGQ